MFNQKQWWLKLTLIVLGVFVLVSTITVITGPLLHEYVIAYSTSAPDGVCVLTFRFVVGRAWGTPDCISKDRYSGTAEWSPDGSKILYSVYKNQYTGGVYEYQTWGGPAKRLSIFCDGIMVTYLISPDLAHIALEGAFSQGIRSTLCIMNLTTKETWYIGEGYSPTWSPDGSKLAYVEDTGPGEEFITIVDRTGRYIKTLAQSPAVSLKWSPDGTWILFSHFGEKHSTISAVNPDTGQIKTLISNISFGVFPAWSPDSRRIAYLLRENAEYHLFIANADGTGPRRLTDMDMDNSEDPQWSPDGTWLSVVSNVHHAMYVVKVDTGEAVQISPTGKFFHLRWQPHE